MTRHQPRLWLLATALSIASLGAALAQDITTHDRLWTRPIAGAADMKVTGMTRAGTDGFIVAGEFSGTIEFGPTPGALSLTASGVKDVFFARLDKAGRYLWARRLGGTGLTQISAFDGAVAGANGSYFLAGSFVGTTDFDPGPGVHQETSQGTIDAFVISFDGGGNLLWAQRFGSPGGNLTVNGLAANAGSVVMVGSCGGGVVINGLTWCAAPGVNAFYINVVADTGNLQGVGYACGDTGCAARTVLVLGNGDFMLTAGSSGSGLYRFGQAPHESGYETIAFDATLALVGDAQGAVYVAGTDYYGHASVAKYTQHLVVGYGWVIDPIWTWTMPGSSSSMVTSLRIDGNGLYAAGRFSGTAELEPWILNSHGMTDAFVFKLGLATGTPEWVASFGGSNVDEAYAIELDDIRNLYAAGIFRGTSDFDPSLAAYNITSAGASDGFVWKFGVDTLDVDGTDPSLIRFSPDDPGMSFDLVKGLLSDLTSSGSYTQAVCLGTFTANPAVDTELPPPGDGFYYLARGRSCCTWQGYGDSTIVPDPRDDLDYGPCP